MGLYLLVNWVFVTNLNQGDIGGWITGDTKRITLAHLVVQNLLGGTAVLGSYAQGILTHESPGAALWGGVPPAIVPLYNGSMLTATAGYLLFAWFLYSRRWFLKF